MVSVLQNMALSQLAYDNGLVVMSPNAGAGWAIDELVKDGKVDGLSYNPSLGRYVEREEECSPLVNLQAIGSYKLIACQSDTTTGFSAMAFQAPTNADGTPGEIVFVFRGTEPLEWGSVAESMKDYITDADIALDNQILTRTQFDDAFDFWQQTLQTVGAGNYSGYSFTGHSLGGGIAQYMTYMTNEVGHSVTFNAVGIGQVLDNVNLADYNDSVTDYVNENDVVGQYGQQLGTTVYIKDNSGYDFHQKLDDGQIALQYATIEAIKRGDLTQAQGLVVYYALSEVRQHAVDAANDSKGVVFGAHGLHTMLDPQGNLMQTVQSPNAAIAMLTLSIEGKINTISLESQVLITIGSVTEQIVAEVAFAFVDGAVNVTTTVGSTVSSWVYNTGDVIADVVYNTARLVGDTANGTANTISLLYQYLFNERIYIDGTDGADTLSPILGASMVAYGREDSDTITGSGYADILDGGLGDDTISAAGGDDFLYGKIGQDTLIGDEGKDIIFGGYGNDVLYGDRVESTGLAHYAGNEDTLDGGEGDDLLEGGYGDDKYMFGRDYGHDTIYDRYRAYSYSTYGSGGSLDEIAFQSGVNPDDITRPTYSYHSAGTLYGYDMHNDIIYGDSGTDDIKAFGGDDRIVGAAGDDTLDGAGGSDTYVFGSGWGQDVVYDGTRNSSDVDTIEFLQGILPNDVSVSRTGDDVVFSYGSTEKVTVKGYFSRYDRDGRDLGVGANKIERAVFAGGTIWDQSTIEDKLRYITGTNGSDTLRGYGANEIIDGKAGNDTISGGSGNDTYMFSGNFGSDLVFDASGSDNIVFDDVRFDQLVFSRVGDDLKVVKAGSTDEVTVQYWRYSLYHIETMKDQDGRTLANTQVDQLIQSMASWSSAHGMSWSDGIANDPASVQSTVAQYWNVPTS